MRNKASKRCTRAFEGCRVVERCRAFNKSKGKAYKRCYLEGKEMDRSSMKCGYSIFVNISNYTRVKTI